jgi:hypothetical protein
VSKYLAILLVPFFVIACSRDTHADYVGLWQVPGGGESKILEITKDGDSYLLDDLRATDMLGKRTSPAVLTVNGPQLAFNFGLGSVPLAISGDKNTLRFDQWELTRVEQSKASEVKQTIVKVREQRESNRASCKALENEFKEKESAISRSGVSGSARMSNVAQLKREFIERTGKVSDCKPLVLFY